VYNVECQGQKNLRRWHRSIGYRRHKTQYEKPSCR